MRQTALLAAFALVLPAFPLDAYADDLPQRKTGLWELTMTAGPGVPPQTMKQCIDSGTDAKLMKMGTDMAGKLGAQCETTGIKKVGAQYINESTCQMGTTKITSKSVFAGDFNKEYSGETTATYDPPLMGMANAKTTLAAKYLGDCEAGQAPGDMVMPGGIKMNINQLGMIPPPGTGVGAAPGTN